MAVDDVLDDGQAQAGSQPLSALLALDAIEALGQARQVLAGDAGAVVGAAQGDEPLAADQVGAKQREPGRAGPGRRQTTAFIRTGR